MGYSKNDIKAVEAEQIKIRTECIKYLLPVVQGTSKDAEEISVSNKLKAVELLMKLIGADTKAKEYTKKQIERDFVFADDDFGDD